MLTPLSDPRKVLWLFLGFTHNPPARLLEYIEVHGHQNDHETAEWILREMASVGCDVSAVDVDELAQEIAYLIVQNGY